MIHNLWLQVLMSKILCNQPPQFSALSLCPLSLTAAPLSPLCVQHSKVSTWHSLCMLTCFHCSSNSIYFNICFWIPFGSYCHTCSLSTFDCISKLDTVADSSNACRLRYQLAVIFLYNNCKAVVTTFSGPRISGTLWPSAL